MRDNALQLALALFRAPMQYGVLHERPLAEDIDTVVRLASASQPLLREIAARFHESEATVLEAARLYLRKALFEPGANAYRVLGLDPGAAQELILERHRWLQRWLHPDRSSDEEAASLAAIANAAWHRLRNADARAEYDAELEHLRVAPAETGNPVDQLRTGEWQAIPAGNSRRWRLFRRAVLTSLLGTCVALLGFALIHEHAPGDEASDETPTAAAGREESPAVAGGETRPSLAVAPAASLSPTQSSAIQPAVLSIKSAAPTVPDPGPESERIFTAASAGIASSQGASGAPVSTELTGPGGASASTPSTASTAATPSNPSTVSTDVALPESAAGRDSDAASDIVLAAAPGRSVSDPGDQRRVGTQQAADRPPSSAGVARSPGSLPNQGRRIASSPDGATTTRQVSVFPARSTPAMSPPETPIAATADARKSSSRTIGANMAPETPIVATTSAVAQTRVIAPAVDARLLVARTDDARDRVRELAHYFSSPDVSAPPVWNDANSQLTAERQRGDLHRRAGIGVGDFDVDLPVWHVSENSASLDATYRLRRGATISESGRLSLNMIWREGMWLVTRVEIEPTS